MTQQFKNLEEFNKFCDESMFCVCGNLMTGLHMSGCRRLAKIRNKLVEEVGKDKRKLAETQESRAETLIRGFAALNRGDLNKATEYLEQSRDKE